MAMVESCYKLTGGLPREEIYGLTSRIRRAAISVPANIAEGYGRDQTGSYIQFLRVAQGLTRELETHLLIATRLNFDSVEDVQLPTEQCGRVSRMLRSLIRTLEQRRDGLV